MKYHQDYVFFKKEYQKKNVSLFLKTLIKLRYIFFKKFKNIYSQRMLLIQCHLFGFSIKLHSVFMQSDIELWMFKTDNFPVTI